MICIFVERAIKIVEEAMYFWTAGAETVAESEWVSLSSENQQSQTEQLQYLSFLETLYLSYL